MTSLYQHQQYHEPNTSVLSDLVLVLRRQPWNQWAGKALNMIRGLLQLALPIAFLSALLLPVAAHARTYDIFAADVPFKFYVGERTFDAGHYEFIFSGSGMLAVRDSRARVVATFVTKSISAESPASASKLVFRHDKKRPYLSQIWIENRSQFTEIVGEELALPTPALDQLLPTFNPMYGTFGYERNVFHFRE